MSHRVCLKSHIFSHFLWRVCGGVGGGDEVAVGKLWWRAGGITQVGLLSLN